MYEGCIMLFQRSGSSVYTTPLDSAHAEGHLGLFSDFPPKLDLFGKFGSWYNSHFHFLSWWGPGPGHKHIFMLAFVCCCVRCPEACSNSFPRKVTLSSFSCLPSRCQPDRSTQLDFWNDMAVVSFWISFRLSFCFYFLLKAKPAKSAASLFPSLLLNMIRNKNTQCH